MCGRKKSKGDAADPKPPAKAKKGEAKKAKKGGSGATPRAEAQAAALLRDFIGAVNAQRSMDHFGRI